GGPGAAPPAGGAGRRRDRRRGGVARAPGVVRGAALHDGDGPVTERLAAPIGILDEHPEWSARLIAELQHRRLPFEKIDHSSHAFDPRDRAHRYSVIVNRTSPSSHRRGHGSVLFYTEALPPLWAAPGVPGVHPTT